MVNVTSEEKGEQYLKDGQKIKEINQIQSENMIASSVWFMFQFALYIQLKWINQI